MRRLKFFGEGSDDVGKHGSVNEPNSIQLLVENILKILLKDNPDFEWNSNQIKKIPYHYGRGTILKRKVELAAAQAIAEGFDGAVFVIDRHGNNNIVKEIMAGRDNFESKGQSFHFSLGIAIEALEAWLLADQNTRRVIFGNKGGEDLGDIENISNPKIIFEELFDNYYRDKDEKPTKGEIKKKLAYESNVEIMAKECPKGFKPFLQEIKDHILPLFENN